MRNPTNIGEGGIQGEGWKRGTESEEGEKATRMGGNQEIIKEKRT